jgi:hypothetical protein
VHDVFEFGMACHGIALRKSEWLESGVALAA